MGFNSQAGLLGLKPSGPLSNPLNDLCISRLLEPVSALSDASRATVVSDLLFDLNFEIGNDWGLWRRLLAHPYKSPQLSKA
jgi:hypothetical protein